MRTQLAHSGCSRPQRTLRRRQTMQLSDNRGFLIWRGSDKDIFQKGTREPFDSSGEGEWVAFYWNHIGVCQKMTGAARLGYDPFSRKLDKSHQLPW